MTPSGSVRGEGPGAARLFSPGSRPEGSRVAELLRQETVGGALLLVATVLALAWANSPWSPSFRC